MLRQDTRVESVYLSQQAQSRNRPFLPHHHALCHLSTDASDPGGGLRTSRREDSRCCSASSPVCSASQGQDRRALYGPRLLFRTGHLLSQGDQTTGRSRLYHPRQSKAELANSAAAARATELTTPSPTAQSARWQSWLPLSLTRRAAPTQVVALCAHRCQLETQDRLSTLSFPLWH